MDGNNNNANAEKSLILDNVLTFYFKATVLIACTLFIPKGNRHCEDG